MASSSSNLGSPISPVSTTHLERTAHEPRDPVRLNLIHLCPSYEQTYFKYRN
jgi:hypothetical protein